MALHIRKGKEGEILAGEYLAKIGFEVKIRNWRSGHYEIDIIAVREGMMHFIEVKTRHSTTYGYPEESVTKKKFNHLKNAAACFLSNQGHFLKIRFDILSILRLPGKPVEFFLIEDVYL